MKTYISFKFKDGKDGQVVVDDYYEPNANMKLTVGMYGVLLGRMTYQRGDVYMGGVLCHLFTST